MYWLFSCCYSQSITFFKYSTYQNKAVVFCYVGAFSDRCRFKFELSFIAEMVFYQDVISNNPGGKQTWQPVFFLHVSMRSRDPLFLRHS